MLRRLPAWTLGAVNSVCGAVFGASLGLMLAHESASSVPQILGIAMAALACILNVLLAALTLRPIWSDGSKNQSGQDFPRIVR
jgi:hypothetical protein